jgi:cytochrome P450
MIMSQFLIHRDPRFYSDPLRFDPDRWAAENQNSRPQFAYFPFGGGPRLCIGEQYAWLEGILIISNIAQKWRLRLEPGHPIELQPMLSLRPKYGMRMLLEKR